VTTRVRDKVQKSFRGNRATSRMHLAPGSKTGTRNAARHGSLGGSGVPLKFEVAQERAVGGCCQNLSSMKNFDSRPPRRAQACAPEKELHDPFYDTFGDTFFAPKRSSRTPSGALLFYAENELQDPSRDAFLRPRSRRSNWLQN
jgi:hypothetical protein